MPPLTIALAGNPNCGKTTLFNALTGARQQVGNWPGVTVERVDGWYQHDDTEVRVVDLPGIYSFSAFALDERIAREFILLARPDVVVNIVDATNLERNLYLTTQLLEMKVPLVVALNMMDLARQRKLRIEIEHLARHLDCPVIVTVASRRRGVQELKQAVALVARGRTCPRTRVHYDPEIEEALATITARVTAAAAGHRVDSRWLAIKLLEHDELAWELAGPDMQAPVAGATQRIERHTGDDIEIAIADGRYGFIHGLSRDVLHHGDLLRRTVSDAIDRIMLNRLLGIPLFFAVMYLVFALTIGVGRPFITFFDRLLGTVAVDGARALLEYLAAPPFLTALVADGIGGGIQTVATFIPPVFFIFLCLSVMESSGYMARAAFVMDRLLRLIGLPGKAFIPMLIGFGCNVPAIVATRTLENRRDRIMAVLMNPLMSCGARLPVYTFFAVGFFPENGPVVIFSLYLTGIGLAVLTGLLLKRTALRGEVSMFVMELPPYHIPTVTGVLHHTWHRLRGFVVRAGKVILVVVVLLRLVSAIGANGRLSSAGAADSLLAEAGKRVTPLFAPMGIRRENWPATVGLFAGVMAKEAVVGTLSALYTELESIAPAVSGHTTFDFWDGIRRAFRAFPEALNRAPEPEAQTDGGTGAPATHTALHKYFGTPTAAYAYLLFILTYAPCVAAVAAISREIGLRWAVFAVLYLIGLAWVISTAFYQLANFFEHPGRAGFWLLVCGGLVGLVVAALRWAGPVLSPAPPNPEVRTRASTAS